MERSLALATLDAMEREIVSSPSRSGSGCQSGWTLYLDHSNGAARYVPCGADPAAAQRWMVLRADGGEDDQEEEEDSMASDASSGPRPRLREPEDGELAPRDLELRRHGFFADHRTTSSSYSTSGHERSRASGSSCFGSSTWSRSSNSQSRAPAEGDVARRTAAVFQGDEGTATRPYREIIVIDDDGDDELDDTASSSAVFSCPVPMVHER